MNKINKLLPFLLLITVFIISSCSKDDDNIYVPKAALRLVNAYPNADAIVFTNGYDYITPPYSPLIYKSYLDNLALFYPGNRLIKVFKAGGQLIAENTIELKDSTYYTSFVYGNTDEANNLFTKDTPIKDLANTKSGVRFLNLASNQNEVNVYLKTLDNPIFENRATETTSGLTTSPNADFTIQDSGNQKVIITDLSNNVLAEKEFNFNGSRHYTILLIGDKNSTTTPLYLGIIKQ